MKKKRNEKELYPYVGLPDTKYFREIFVLVDFKTSHVRTFFPHCQMEGLAHSTIKGLYGLLNPSFELAVEDGIIRKNPVTGTLGDYGAPAKEKEALTLEQQENF